MGENWDTISYEKGRVVSNIILIFLDIENNLRCNSSSIREALDGVHVERRQIESRVIIRHPEIHSVTEFGILYYGSPVQRPANAIGVKDTRSPFGFNRFNKPLQN